MLLVRADNKPALDYYAPVDELYGIKISNTDNPEISQVEIPPIPDFPEELILQLSNRTYYSHVSPPSDMYLERLGRGQHWNNIITG